MSILVNPMTVSEQSGSIDTKEIYLNRWAKYDSLPEVYRENISSIQTEDIILELGQKNNLYDNEIEELARITRDLFFGVINESSLAGEIVKRIPSINMQNAQAITDEIISKIYNAKLKIVQPRSMEVSQANVVELKPKLDQIDIKEALKKYPKLQYQVLTSRPLMLKDHYETVQPNVSNWILDYQQRLGFQPHTTINRVNYIFHSENGARMSEADRNKLMYILKSLDDNVLIQVNDKMQQIVFPKNLVEMFEANAVQKEETAEPGREEVTMRMNPGQAQFRSQQKFQPIRTSSASQETAYQQPQDRSSMVREVGLARSQSNQAIASGRQDALKNIYNQGRLAGQNNNSPEFNLKDFTVGAKSANPSPSKSQNITFSSPQTLPYEYENQTDNKEK